MISVVIPIYNDIRHLKGCLDSVLGQTRLESLSERGNSALRRDSIEIIIVDDGSDEETAKKIMETAGNVRVLKTTHGGAAAARNRGFAESRGEFIFFCDADVGLRRDCLEMMMDNLKNHPEASYVYSDYNFGYKKMSGMPFDGEKLKKTNYISTMSLIRRQDFPGFDQSLKRFQDWDLWLTLLERGKIGVYIPEALFRAYPSKFGMSRWRPAFWYKLFPWTKSVREYNEAREIILKKHNLV